MILARDGSSETRRTRWCHGARIVGRRQFLVSFHCFSMYAWVTRLLGYRVQKFGGVGLWQVCWVSTGALFLFGFDLWY